MTDKTKYLIAAVAMFGAAMVGSYFNIPNAGWGIFCAIVLMFNAI